MGVLVKNLFGLLIMCLELVDKSRDLPSLWFILELKVGKDDIEVDRIFFLLIGPTRRELAIVLSILLVWIEGVIVRPALIRRSLSSCWFLEELQDAVTFQFLLDNVLENLNVIALLLVCYCLLAKGLLYELILVWNCVEMVQFYKIPITEL